MQDKPATSLIAPTFKNTPEQLEPIRLNVKGTIPSWLTGRLYRIGPGTFEVPLETGGTFQVKHWFDGFGMAHSFEIKDGGEVWYRNRKVAQHLEESIAATGEVPIITFAPTDPCESTFHKFFTFFKHAIPGLAPVTDQASSFNVSVTLTPDMPGAPVPEEYSATEPSRASYLVGKTDADVSVILDADTLEPLAATAYNKMHPELVGSLFTGAHACSDPITGDFFNYVTKLGRTPSYSIFRIRGTGPERGKVDVLAHISDAPIAYIHSSCLTDKYYILCVWQADVRANGFPILLNRNFLDGIEQTWDPKRPTLFYVIDRENGGVIAKYKSSPFFCFHMINSYDDGDDIVMDLSVYDDHRILWSLSVEQMTHPLDHPPIPKGVPKRFRLRNVSCKPDLAEVVTSFHAPESKTIELPVVNPAYYHKRYRYAYGISIGGGRETVLADQLLKLDMDHPRISSDDVLHDGSGKIWRETDCVPGEPIFVPNPEGTEEDDGIVLSVVLDGKSVKSMLVVLDAKDMKEIARAEMDIPFPMGFHGVFVG